MQNLILECAVRAFLIAICMGAVLSVLRVKAPRVRHAVWAGVVVLMLALPLWTAWGPRTAVRVLSPVTAPAVNRSIVSADAISGQAAPPVRGLTWTWQSWLAAIYLLGFCALMARLAIGTARAYMLVRGAANREGRPTSDSCAAPVTAGWLNPTVILPEHWRQWPQAELRAVLTHEEEQERWRDPLVQWLALLNRAVFWFHPLAWWLERRLSALAEEACDAAVLARGHDPFQYSEYLLEIARAMRQAGARVRVIGMAMPGAFLPQRIRRILEGRPAPPISRARLVCVAMACAAVSTVFTAGAMDHAQAQTNRQSVTNPQPQAIPPVPELPHGKPIVLLAQAQTSPPKPNAASQDGGSISGTVLDPSGARVPGCLVVMHNQSGASENTTRSDAAGIYRFASIPPGHYNLEFQMPGFAKLNMEMAIEAGKALRIDAGLLLGQMSETIEVVGQKPAAAPAPSAARPASDPDRIAVGGRVDHARLLTHSNPVYPPELQQQGIEGTVRLAAVISRDGEPVEIRVLNGDRVDSRFVQAALDSVRQWRYQPAKLNERPVSTVINIDVNFQLGK